jgi:hypothetical protein
MVALPGFEPGKIKTNASVIITNPKLQDPTLHLIRKDATSVDYQNQIWRCVS